MKLKSKLLLKGIFALLIVFVGTNIQAQHKHRHAHPHAKKRVVHRNQAKVTPKVAHKANINHSLKVIKRTNNVIVKAHKLVKQNKVYTGSLSKAVHHQRHAKILLKSHKSHRAMQHSRLARNYAFKAIKSNKGVVSKENLFSAEENMMMGETISSVELEKELKENNPQVTFDDKNISDKEMSDLEVIETDPADYKND